MLANIEGTDVQVVGEAASPTAPDPSALSEADVVLLADEELLEEAAIAVAEDGVFESVARPSHKPTKVIVTSDDALLPDGCRPRQIAELVIEFIDAFNRGNQERLAQLFFISEGPSPRTSRSKDIIRGRGTG